MTRQLLISKTPHCPRCKFNDKISKFKEGKIYNNVKNWFRSNTTYTEDQLKEATHYCDRCLIVFKMEDKN